MVFGNQKFQFLISEKTLISEFKFKKKLTFDIKKSWISDLENSNWEFEILISMNKH